MVQESTGKLFRDVGNANLIFVHIYRRNSYQCDRRLLMMLPDDTRGDVHMNASELPLVA